jgi:hypothetical protein
LSPGAAAASASRQNGSLPNAQSWSSRSHSNTIGSLRFSPATDAFNRPLSSGFRPIVQPILKGGLRVESTHCGDDASRTRATAPRFCRDTSAPPCARSRPKRYPPPAFRGRHRSLQSRTSRARVPTWHIAPRYIYHGSVERGCAVAPALRQSSERPPSACPAFLSHRNVGQLQHKTLRLLARPTGFEPVASAFGERRPVRATRYHQGY